MDDNIFTKTNNIKSENQNLNAIHKPDINENKSLPVDSSNGLNNKDSNKDENKTNNKSDVNGKNNGRIKRRRINNNCGKK